MAFVPQRPDQIMQRCCSVGVELQSRPVQRGVNGRRLGGRPPRRLGDAHASRTIIPPAANISRHAAP
eukprot:2779746-Prymnesium_polylepis.1